MWVTESLPGCRNYLCFWVVFWVRGSPSYSLFTVADIVTGLCVLCEVRDLDEETVFHDLRQLIFNVG